MLSSHRRNLNELHSSQAVGWILLLCTANRRSQSQNVVAKLGKFSRSVASALLSKNTADRLPFLYYLAKARVGGLLVGWKKTRGDLSGFGMARVRFFFPVKDAQKFGVVVEVHGNFGMRWTMQRAVGSDRTAVEPLGAIQATFLPVDVREVVEPGAEPRMPPAKGLAVDFHRPLERDAGKAELPVELKKPGEIIPG